MFPKTLSCHALLLIALVLAANTRGPAAGQADASAVARMENAQVPNRQGLDALTGRGR